MNPFWFQAYLAGIVLGGVLLVVTLVALVAWLIRRPRGTLLSFVISIGSLAVVGALTIVSLALIGSSWP